MLMELAEVSRTSAPSASSRNASLASRWQSSKVPWTARAWTLAPRVVNWIQRVDDLGWWEVDGDEGWCDAAELPAGVHALLREAGSTYAPFMAANAAALDGGADEVVCEIRGSEYRQAPFKYQGKCLVWLREAHDALDDVDRRRVDEILAGTGCEQLFA